MSKNQQQLQAENEGDTNYLHEVEQQVLHEQAMDFARCQANTTALLRERNGGWSNYSEN